MRRGGEDLDEVANPAVVGGVEQDDQEDAEAEVHGAEGDGPGALRFCILKKKRRGARAINMYSPGELLGDTLDEHAKLAGEAAGFGEKI